MDTCSHHCFFSHCCYGVAGPNSATCPNFSDCSFCANSNYHNCHDITNIDARIDSLSNFIFENIASCNSNFLGENDLKINNILALYPNPTSGTLQIAANDSKVSLSLLEVYSMSGQLLLSRPISTKEYIHVVNLSELKTGIYLVSVHTNRGTIIKKIVKE